MDTIPRRNNLNKKKKKKIFDKIFPLAARTKMSWKAFHKCTYIHIWSLHTFVFLSTMYKVAFDSSRRNGAFAAMSEPDSSAKLNRLCRMALSNTCSSAKVERELSEPFDACEIPDKATFSTSSWRAFWWRQWHKTSYGWLRAVK